VSKLQAYFEEVCSTSHSGLQKPSHCITDQSGHIKSMLWTRVLVYVMKLYVLHIWMCPFSEAGATASGPFKSRMR
jgi:hypothetical protein